MKERTEPGKSGAKIHGAGWGTRDIALPEEVWERLAEAPVVLEIGCGTGHLLNLLQERCQGLVVGLDRDPELLQLARQQYPRLLTYLADAQQALALRDGCVAVALSSDVLEHLPDPAAHLREVRRVLCPGGLYVVKTPNATLDALYWQLCLTRRNLRRHRGLEQAWAEARAERLRPGSHCSTQTCGSLRRLMRENGFQLLQMVKQPPSTTQRQKLARLPQPLRTLFGAASSLVPLLPYTWQWSLVGVFQKPLAE